MKKNELFELIKSLSKAEKRNFKLHTSKYEKGDGNNYLKLFEAYDKMETFDEDLLEKKFKKVKNLSYTRNYLYNTILKSLRDFHSDISEDARLKDMLREAEILFKKGLYNQCLNLLVRGKEMAERFDKFLLLLEILECERKVRLRMESLADLKTVIERNYEEENRVLSLYQNLCHHRNLSRRIFLETRKSLVPRGKKDLKPFKVIYEDPLLQSEKNAHSPEALFNYHNTLSFYYQASADWEKLFNQRKELVRLFDSKKTREVIGYEGMFVAINNYIVACNGLGKFNEAMQAISQAKQLGSKVPYFSTSLYNINIFSLELSTLLDMRRFSDALEVVTSFLSTVKLEDSEVNESQRVILSFAIGYVYFTNDDPKEACKWLRKIFAIKNTENRPDIHHFAIILSIIIKTESGELTVKQLHQAIESIRKSGRLKETEKALFSFFIDHVQEGKSKKQQLLFKLKTDLQRILKDPYEQKVLQFIDLFSWIESRLTGRSFTEIALAAPNQGSFIFPSERFTEPSEKNKKAEV